MLTPEQINILGDAICSVWEDFDIMMFINDILLKLSDLDGEAQVLHIRKCLTRYLPKDYGDALVVLQNTLPILGQESLITREIYMSYGSYILHHLPKNEMYKSQANALYEVIKKQGGL